MTWLGIARRQIQTRASRVSIGRHTFGDADRPQDAVDEEDAIEALSVNIDFSKKILSVWRSPLRLKDLVEVVEVLHLGCGLPASSRSTMTSLTSLAGLAAIQCDARAGLEAPRRDGCDSLSASVKGFAEHQLSLANM